MTSKSFFEGPNFKYVMLALTLISAIIIWLKISPRCSSFSIKVEGIELNMDSYELCDEKQVEQLVDSVFQAGANYALKKTKETIKEQTTLKDQPTRNTLLLMVEQVERRPVKKKVTVKIR